jgi:arsenate reductase
MPEPVVWFNPSCSKCPTAQGILTDHGIAATYLDYQREPPTTAELLRVMEMLGTIDPRTIARTGESLWRDLRLDDATDEEVLAALAAHPSLIERPIVIVGDRAVVARPPERVLEVIGDATAGRAD